jgi:Mrp family chromosome partitioning ATPase/uncharacterized protein involved in exopolysaccharide biosynthesis
MGMREQQVRQLEGKPRKPFDIFGFVYRYGWIIIIAGFFILAMLVPVVLKIARPNYEVHASLKIDPVVASLITKSDDLSITAFYHDYVRTQARRIKEYTLLEKAIDNLSMKEKQAIFPGDMPTKDCVAILDRIMTITSISGTHLVDLSIQGPNREGLAPMLNAVMDEYLRKMEGEVENKNERRLKYLTLKKEELAGLIGKKEKDLRSIASSVFSSSFAEDFNIWQQRAVDLQEAYVRSFSQRIEAENAFNSAKTKTEQLAKLPLDPLIDEAVMDNRAIGFTSSWTYQKLQDMRTTIDGVTRENEDRKRVEERMEAMREYEKKQRTETTETLHAIAYGKRDLELKQELIKKEITYREAMKNEAALTAALDEAKVASGANSSALLHGKSLETELGHARDLIFRIDNRIQELEAESRAPLRVTIEARAMAPDKPAGSNIKKLLIVCIALSFGSVGGLFLVIELLDNRLHSPKDVTQALGHPPSWPISRGLRGNNFLTLLTTCRNSAAAKAIRSLATRLYREYEEHHSRIFLFTATDEKSGTTEIMLNTAQALTHHASRVLVIDGNLRQEDLFLKLNVPDSHPGIEEVLAGTRSLTDCIYHDQERTVDVLFSHCTIPDQVMIRKLGVFLRQAREDYDVICIDSCPVMLCDFTEFLAVQADVAVLISQGDSTLYKNLRRTADIFLRLGVPALAPVLNWGGEKNEIWFDTCLDRSSRIFYGMFASLVKKNGQKGAAV